MTNHAARSRALGVLDVLCALYPSTFVPLDVTPRLLAIGIREAIQAEHPDIPLADLRRATGLYCCRAAYRKATVAGAERVDLSGRVVSVITDEELGRIREAQATKKAARKASKIALNQDAETAVKAVNLPSPEAEPPPIVEPLRPRLSLPRRTEPRRSVVVEVVKRRRIAGPMR